ncbi:hypothetical protein BDN67DRAFT_1016816 [Paxillus ammoniavirescens]|nr:hypothetical protein BDN67DRAFT_1016816 [Paxillus ammoniavirescens]
MAAQRHADTMHNPGGQADAPGSAPLSVQLEGEIYGSSSWHVKPNDVEVVEMDNEDVEGHHDHTQQPSRHPVGTTDSDEPRPNSPTEPPDEKDGEQEVDSELGDKSQVETRIETVEPVQSNELS